MGGSGLLQWVLTVGTCFLCVVSSGCMGWSVNTEPPFQYVLDKGNDQAIAEWTTRQIDAWEITNGIDALIYRMRTALSVKAARADVELLVPLYDRLEDWPEDRMLSAGPRDHWTTKQLLSRVLFDAWKNVSFSPISEELFDRLRPNSIHLQWLPLWEQNAAKLEAFKKQEATRREASTKPGTATTLLGS